MTTREATHDDIEYFVESGREFCAKTPFDFDAEGYAENVARFIDSDECIAVVTGDPVSGHSVGVLVSSFWRPDNILCKIFTTSGRGGLRCFREVERRAADAGAKYLFADSWLEPRIISYYEKNGMSLTDKVFLKELKSGN